MRIYLAGPMRGRPQLNKKSFAFYATHLREAGHFVFDPAELEEDGGTGNAWTRQELQEVLLADLNIITTCDAVVLLPEWWTSKGAATERLFAHFLDIPVVDYRGRVWTFLSEPPKPVYRNDGDPSPIIPLTPHFFDVLLDVEGGIYA